MLCRSWRAYSTFHIRTCLTRRTRMICFLANLVQPVRRLAKHVEAGSGNESKDRRENRQMTNAPAVHIRLRTGRTIISRLISLSERRVDLTVWIVIAELALMFLIRLPSDLGFNTFGFTDAGDNLTANFLIGQGRIPAVDFGYPYGLLGLLAARAWFGLFGPNPFSQLYAMWLSEGLIAFAVARWVRALGNKTRILIPLLLMLPFTIFGFQTFSQALEAVFIFHALASHAAGRRSQALAFCAAAVLAKPAIAYFYGLILIGLIALDLWRIRALNVRSMVIAVSPAAAVASSLILILILYFGPLALGRTILPFTGARAYVLCHFGFFQIGSLFWKPPHPTLVYYLESPAGFWLVATAVLFTAALCQLVRPILKGTLFDGLQGVPELTVSCALLHLIGITVLWGNQFSYKYYCFILVLGLLTTWSLGAGWRAAILTVALLVPLGKIGVRILDLVGRSVSSNAQAIVAREGSDTEEAAQMSHTYDLWSVSRRDPITAGLWSSSAERDEWEKVLTISRGHSTVLLKADGCADLLFQQFSKPVGVFLDPGLPLPAELVARERQIRASAMVVVPTGESGLLQVWPDIGLVVSKQFRVIFKDRRFTIFQRTS